MSDSNSRPISVLGLSCFADDSAACWVCDGVVVAAVQEERSALTKKYMLTTARVKNGKIPAVRHVDGTALLQTVEETDNPLFYQLIAEFERLTGVPMLINCSFNLEDEPIVCRPEDAENCFLRIEIDILALGKLSINKTDMSAK